jgi:hypothetical protein
MAAPHNRHSHHAEAVIGRAAALFVHPFAAWHSPSRKDRAILLLSYFAISYMIVFTLLHAFSS